jgi:hypothetical protein
MLVRGQLHVPTHWIRDWVGPRAYLWTLWNRKKISCPCWESKSGCPARIPLLDGSLTHPTIRRDVKWRTHLNIHSRENVKSHECIRANTSKRTKSSEDWETLCFADLSRSLLQYSAQTSSLQPEALTCKLPLHYTWLFYNKMHDSACIIDRQQFPGKQGPDSHTARTTLLRYTVNIVCVCVCVCVKSSVFCDLTPCSPMFRRNISPPSSGSKNMSSKKKNIWSILQTEPEVLYPRIQFL